jgi:hypothetical protein
MNLKASVSASCSLSFLFIKLKVPSLKNSIVIGSQGCDMEVMKLDVQLSMDNQALRNYLNSAV